MLHEEQFLSVGHSARFRAECSLLCSALPGATRSFHTYSDRAGCRKRHSAAQKELGSFSALWLPLTFRSKKYVESSTRWFQLRPFVRQGGHSDLTPFGPAGVCECVFVAGVSYNPVYHYHVPQDFQR
jgi:hypothetical protein